MFRYLLHNWSYWWWVQIYQLYFFEWFWHTSNFEAFPDKMLFYLEFNGLRFIRNVMKLTIPSWIFEMKSLQFMSCPSRTFIRSPIWICRSGSSRMQMVLSRVSLLRKSHPFILVIVFVVEKVRERALIYLENLDFFSDWDTRSLLWALMQWTLDKRTHIWTSFFARNRNSCPKVYITYAGIAFQNSFFTRMWLNSPWVILMY